MPWTLLVSEQDTHSLALLPSFQCNAFAATSTTKKNLENPDGRWLLSWKAKVTCLPQLNYNEAQPEWRLNRIRLNFLRRVCRYLLQCKNQLRSLAKKALLIWFPLFWTRCLCRLWWTTTIMIPGNNKDAVSRSICLCLCLQRGCLFVDSSIKWFIVGCACKVLKTIASIPTSVSGTADTAHFATCFPKTKKAMVSFTWVAVRNPQETQYPTIQLCEESFSNVIDNFIILLAKVTILTETPRLLPMTASGLPS